MIPEQTIAEIRERTDIIALVGDYVPLRRVGTTYRGLCPFHAEKTPSFYVHPGRQYFHCFGCHASGDSIAFLMQLEGLSFVEATRRLADFAGIALPEESSHESREAAREQNRKERLVSLMEAAAGFFRQKLSSGDSTQIARNELSRRGVSSETADSFRLGYAPAEWEGLSSFLRAEGFSLADAEQVGLVLKKRGDHSSTNGYFDRFRHRLMFPISDVHGRIVAFSGRTLEMPASTVHREGANHEGEQSGVAKYLNSPEHVLFKKGALLFGLHEARLSIRRQGYAIVCEGNFDVVALHQAGFTHAVAPLGTAFTEAQAKLLKRYAERVILLFDADSAGRKATQAAVVPLKEAGLTAVVASLPDGNDPDSYLRNHSVGDMQQLLDNAKGIFEHLIDDAAERAGGDAQACAKAIEELGAYMDETTSPVERAMYVERISRKFGIHDPRAVSAQMLRGARGKQKNTTRRSFGPNPHAGALGTHRLNSFGAGAPNSYGGAETTAPQGHPLHSHPTTPSSYGRRTASVDAERGFQNSGAESHAQSKSVSHPQQDSVSSSGIERRHVQPGSPRNRISIRLQCELVGALLDQPSLFQTSEARKLEELLTDADLRSIFQHSAQMVSSRGTIDATVLLSQVSDLRARRWLEKRLTVEKYDGDTATNALKSGIPVLAKRNIEEQLPRIVRQIEEARRLGDEQRARMLTEQHIALSRSAYQAIHTAKR